MSALHWRASPLLEAALTLVVILAALVTASVAHARVEEVYVAKVLDDDDKTIIVRRSGEAYLIEKGTGCLSLWRYEGKVVLIISPGIFLGVGSKLLIPQANQECRIWDSESLGTWGGFRPQQPLSPQVLPSAQAVLAAQMALALLGYDPGPADGILGEKTTAAISSFQRHHRITPVGPLSRPTLLALAAELYRANPSDPQVLQLALSLLTLAKGGTSGDCEEGHWISSVAGGGKIIILEDGSVWEVDPIDIIYTAIWLPTESVIICGNTMINTDNGEKVSVTRLR